MRYINFEEPGLVPDEFFMVEALKEAKIALGMDEVPIGAVVVCKGTIIGRGHNLTERLNDVTAHAEMQAFTAAANYLGGKYLKDCSLYVTVEPCLMCCGALYWSKIGTVVYGARDDKNGYEHITRDVFPFHPKTKLTGGILADECGALMTEFFRSKR